jgi:hypothetical protein
VVPVDAEHLARVLQAKRHLEAARERIDPRRWELFYAPSYRVLVDDLLPDFPDTLGPTAAAIALHLPNLPIWSEADDGERRCSGSARARSPRIVALGLR